MEKLNSVFLSLGSDLGDKVFNLKQAIALIESNIGSILKVSSVFQSEPWGFESKTSFYNIAIEVNTQLSPKKVLEKTQSIEKEIGRANKSNEYGYESRIIDIDIILFNDLIFQDSELTIPHPLFHKRNFVLIPLAEISPLKTDPNTSLTIRQLKSNCPDTSVGNVIALDII